MKQPSISPHLEAKLKNLDATASSEDVQDVLTSALLDVLERFLSKHATRACNVERTQLGVELRKHVCSLFGCLFLMHSIHLVSVLFCWYVLPLHVSFPEMDQCSTIFGMRLVRFCGVAEVLFCANSID